MVLRRGMRDEGGGCRWPSGDMCTRENVAADGFSSSVRPSTKLSDVASGEGGGRDIRDEAVGMVLRRVLAVVSSDGRRARCNKLSSTVTARAWPGDGGWSGRYRPPEGDISVGDSCWRWRPSSSDDMPDGLVVSLGGEAVNRGGASSSASSDGGGEGSARWLLEGSAKSFDRSAGGIFLVVPGGDAEPFDSRLGADAAPSV